MFNTVKNQPIYKHTHLNQKEADALKPLMESAFQAPLEAYNDRPQVKAERLKFMTEQYANRARIAGNMGTTPLFEDSRIFANMPQISKMFESVSTPANMIGMGDVSNPDSSNSHTGGIWNPSYKAGSGDIPSYVFGLQAHLAMYCIGFDLMPVISVDTPKIMVSYVDTVYGGGAFDELGEKPSFIEISCDLFTRAWIKAKALKRATTEVIIRANDGTAMKVLFIVGSTVKSAITAEVLSTGTSTVATGTITYVWDDSVTVKGVADAVAVATGSLVFVATPTTLSAGEAITAIGVGYASAVRTNIAEAASNNNSLGGMSRKQHAKGPKHKLNVIAMDKQLEMKGIEIEADTDNIQIKDMAAMGINVIAHLYTGVQNQLVQTLDEIILNHLYALGAQHAVNAYTSQGINHSLYIAAPAKTTLTFSAVDVVFDDMTGTDVRSKMGAIDNSIQSAGYENQMTHADRLYARLLLVAEFGGQQNRIAPYDYVVVPGEIASCLKKNATFSACPKATTLTANPELSYSGTIFETISVYKNPRIAFNDVRVVMGRRGNDTDPGPKFLAYDLAASRQMVVEGTMAEKIRVWSRFEIADIGFYPELNAYTLIAVNEYKWA